MDLRIDENTAATARLSARIRLEDIRGAIAATEALRPFAGKYLTKRIMPDLTAAIKAAWPEITNVYIDETPSGRLYLCITPRLAYTRRHSIPVGWKRKEDNASYSGEAPDRRILLKDLTDHIASLTAQADKLTADLAAFDAVVEQWNRAMQYAATLHGSLCNMLRDVKSGNAERIYRIY